jgi:hypothetical protein
VHKECNGGQHVAIENGSDIGIYSEHAGYVDMKGVTGYTVERAV